LTGILLKTPLEGNLPFAAFRTARTVFSCPPNFETKPLRQKAKLSEID